MATSLIAAELGVSQAALFKRIGTKRELMLRALAPPAKPTWIAAVEHGPDDRPVGEQLRELIGNIDTFFTTLMPCIAVLGSAHIDPHEMFKHYPEPPPVRAHRVVTAWFSALHDSGRAQIPCPMSAATAMLSAIQGRHMMRHMLGEAAPPCAHDYLEQLETLVGRGIASLESQE